MDFVVNNQAPLALFEEAKMEEGAVFGFAVGQHLVGGEGHGLDDFVFAAVFAQIIFRQVGLIEDFVFPLAQGDGVGRENQGVGLHRGQGPNRDDRFPRTTGQHHDATPPAIASARVKGLHGLPLILAQAEFPARKTGVPQVNFVGRAVGIARQIFHGKTQFDEGTLYIAPVPRFHEDALAVGGARHKGLDGFLVQ